ncbi:hypothetical protein D0Z03_000430 [Geotrichum reessii]|nr:hypothetical protein D0Z03_000430 [Galactomyces reessii]
MFRSTILSATKTTVRGVRFNSTAAAKATAAASGIVNKASALVSKTVFWSKVVAELGKQIYIKEGLAPPTGPQFKAVFESLKTLGLDAFKRPQYYIEAVKANSSDYSVKFLVGAVQVLGIFSLGEIIGRRKIVGYRHH